jgi:hypothetical protein
MNNPRILEIDKELKNLIEESKTATPAYRDFMRMAYKLKLAEKHRLEKET